MQKLDKLFRYGMGPSSSHTIGPRRAAESFNKNNPDAAKFRVTLYGSLSLTGKGHLTDVAIIKGLAPREVEVVWSNKALDFHPNGMTFEALTESGEELKKWTIFSVGGGALKEEGDRENHSPTAESCIYEQHNMKDVLSWAQSNAKPIWQLVYEVEGEKEVTEYLTFVWEKMKEAIKSGLYNEGVLPGGLRLPRKAKDMLARARRLKESEGKSGIISGYALAVAEENGSGGHVITAPTCGSCGVLPAVLYYMYHDQNHSESSIIKALATAGMVGNIVKRNGSISGAEVGCQGEIGVACSMAAAAAVQILGGMPSHVEYAAEMGLEHHLGLTCDPVLGLVQIPCIERNAFAAVRAISCAEYALLSDGRHRVSFDEVVETMMKTGKDMSSLYRETSLGGLAKVYDKTK